MTAEDFLNGQIILIDKPLNWTSFQVVNKLKWSILKGFKLKKIKIGHAGTLDPLASGLLVVCTGKLTKQIPEIQSDTKTYTGVIRLGATTPSYDLETEINQTFATNHITESDIEAVRQSFLGEVMQTPPIFSALKKDGKRLYDLARSGKEVEVSPRKITIEAFSLDSKKFPDLHFEVRCSKGTYIRSLAFDVGRSLNSGAHLSELRRTKIGDFSVGNAFLIEDFIAKHINSDKE